MLNTTFRKNTVRTCAIWHTKSVPFVLCLFWGVAQASELVPATVVSVYDGDSITVEADLWPGLSWDGSIRVRGVDTPEINGECEEEERMAQEAKAFVEGLVLGKTVFLHQVHEEDRYGRPLAYVLVDGEDLTTLLIEAGHGRAYEGGAREGWCE